MTPIPRLRLERFAPVIERAYAATLLCCLTLGIVTYFWTDRLSSASPDIAEAVRWTFVVLQLPALALLARRVHRNLIPAVWAVAALVGWLMLSVSWSAVPVFSLTEATSLTLTCCAGLYLAGSFTWREMTALIFIAMQPGLILSYVAIERSWPGAGDASSPAGVAGIYGNRNSLGPPAVVAVGCGVVLIAVALTDRRRPRYRAVVLAIVLLVVVLFDLDLQRRSQSMTSWLMLATFLGTVLVLTIVQVFAPVWRRSDPGVVAGRSILGFCAAAFLVGLAFNERVSQALGRPPGFNQRTVFWEADIDGFWMRPLIGWGWLAAWRADAFRSALRPSLANEYGSHSAYMDVALGGGIVAVVLGVLVAVTGTRSAGRVLFRPADTTSVMPLALIVAIAVGCTEESFFVGNYFLTALLVAGLCASVRTASSVAATDVELTTLVNRAELQPSVG